ncbi:Na+/H+ antiporter NhaC [Pseudemcibacter aquimaris]|uniref:Na+/H+ antiporter NhaC n=1 Tax=Pseudemcibacter aquimaris TaxID=2857064 RepID=UPI0020124C11|nr:Na+/H+ antiporter NhaC [Pseudemcibacter aquimaris]MCC3860969.1 Na+/H+ antiporter NhaC [Pseudemcibacter aquimaris]WDU59787.1 Na+/H+ antiporter NhaC [Pseudemcibacter aquimaris]
MSKQPSFLHSAICFGGIIVMIITGLIVYSIPIHVIIILAIVWTAVHSYFLGYRFPEMKAAMSKGIERGLSAMYIFILIGVVIASYLESGTITSIVYYSLDLISPSVFLPAGLLICSFMSLAVGTSWGTVGTAGVILIGVGSAMGIPLPIVAGAVVSGATFGDKLSPVSDTTNLAAVAAGTDLYKHIKSMIYTTIPTYVICIVLFALVGMQYSADSVAKEGIEAFQSAIADNYIVSIWSLLPLVVLFTLSMRKKAAEIAMISSVGMAVLLALFLQDRSIFDVLINLHVGHSAETGHAGLNSLVNRGGVMSMMETLSMTLFALALGGLLDKGGYLRSLLTGILDLIRSVFALMLATICTGILACCSMGESYISIIVTSQLFKKKYEEMKLKPYMLSRSVEESTTMSSPLIPWSTAGAFYFGAMGIPVLDYLPYTFLNLLNPIVSLVMTYFGIAVFREVKKELEIQSAK